MFTGNTGDELCPVAAILAYLLVRGAVKGPLFQFADGKPLTGESFVERVREALRVAGVDYNSYSGHSFRAGAATTAAKNDATIKKLQHISCT